MGIDISKIQKKLSENLKSNGYNHKNLILLGSGSEGAIFSNGYYTFKFFFEGITALTQENLSFIMNNFVNNKKISGVRLLSDIIHDGKDLIFITPYEEYHHYKSGDVENIMKILVDSKNNNYIFTNFHPKNIMYDKDMNLKIIDIGKSLEPYEENKYQNMVCRAFLSTYYFERRDLTDIMSAIHKSSPPKELTEMNRFLNLLYDELETIH